MKLILRWLIIASTLILIGYYLPGIAVISFYSALIAALILGLINAIIRPILLVLTIPINILTLGLFTFVINALMFWLTSTVVKGLYVDDFKSAFFGALILTIASWIVNSLFKSKHYK